MTAGVVASATALAQDEDSNGADSSSRGRRFEVTVTNLTKGQQFTPILIASHIRGLTLFTEGSPASAELRELAEEGDVGPLTDALQRMREAREVVFTSGLLNPGASVTMTVAAGGYFDHK